MPIYVATLDAEGVLRAVEELPPGAPEPPPSATSVAFMLDAFDLPTDGSWRWNGRRFEQVVHRRPSAVEVAGLPDLETTVGLLIKHLATKQRLPRQLIAFARAAAAKHRPDDGVDQPDPATAVPEDNSGPPGESPAPDSTPGKPPTTGKPSAETPR